MSSERWRKLATLGIAATMIAGTLAGCAEGSSRGAQRGKALDAQRTSVVSDLQATQSVQVLLPGTPPPPTSTPQT